MAKYRLVIQWIKNRIEDGELRDGDRLESENVLSARFGISRQTVRHALAILEQEGLVQGRQGSGNYVTLSHDFEPAGKSRTVILVSTYVNAYIFPRIIQTIEQVLAEQGYALRVVFTYNKFMTERRVLEDILKLRHVDGLIVEPTQSALPNPNLSYYREILKRKIPILFFHSYYENLPISHVSLNDREAGYTATKYLLESGHTEIGGIFKLEDAQGHRRFAGYVEALTEAGLPTQDERIVWIDTQDEQQNLKHCKEKILERLQGCTACVCYNDSVAHALSLLCREANIRIPSDLSIVGIDNSELAQLNITPLTTVIHPMEKLGERTARQFLELVKHPEKDVTYEFPAVLTVRDSVQKI